MLQNQVFVENMVKSIKILIILKTTNATVEFNNLDSFDIEIYHLDRVRCLYRFGVLITQDFAEIRRSCLNVWR
jgi:hypothetical protein